MRQEVLDIPALPGAGFHLVPQSTSCTKDYEAFPIP